MWGIWPSLCLWTHFCDCVNVCVFLCVHVCVSAVLTCSEWEWVLEPSLPLSPLSMHASNCSLALGFREQHLMGQANISLLHPLSSSLHSPSFIPLSCFLLPSHFHYFSFYFVFYSFSSRTKGCDMYFMNNSFLCSVWLSNRESTNASQTKKKDGEKRVKEGERERGKGRETNEMEV